MTTLQQAAQAIHDDVRILFETSSRLEQIQSHLAPVQAELDQSNSDCNKLHDEIVEWKEATGLEVGGDPGGVEPRHLVEHIQQMDKELDRLKREMNEAREFVQKRYLRLFHDYSDSSNFVCNPTCEKCAAKAWLERNK